jgi:hypothetical protein
MVSTTNTDGLWGSDLGCRRFYLLCRNASFINFKRSTMDCKLSFGEGDVNHQFASYIFQFSAEFRHCTRFGYLQPSRCFEYDFARHWCAGAFSLQFFHVDLLTRQCSGYFVYDTRPVLAYQAERCASCRLRKRYVFIRANDCGQSMRLQSSQGLHQSLFSVLRDVNSQYAREFPSQTAHPAFQPIAAIFRYEPGQRFQKAGSVPADDRHNQWILHGAVLLRFRRASLDNNARRDARPSSQPPNTGSGWRAASCPCDRAKDSCRRCLRQKYTLICQLIDFEMIID